MGDKDDSFVISFIDFIYNYLSILLPYFFVAVVCFIINGECLLHVTVSLWTFIADGYRPKLMTETNMDKCFGDINNDSYNNRLKKKYRQRQSSPAR